MWGGAPDRWTPPASGRGWVAERPDRAEPTDGRHAFDHEAALTPIFTADIAEQREDAIAAGTAVGGSLVEHVDWHACFVTAVGSGVLGAALAFTFRRTLWIAQPA